LQLNSENIESNLSSDEILFLLNSIDKNIVTFNNSSTDETTRPLTAADVLLNNSSDYLFDAATLRTLYELSNSLTDGSNYHYSLNTYSTGGLYDFDEELEPVSLITDIEELRKIFLAQPYCSLAHIDIVSQEYAKNLYTYINLIFPKHSFKRTHVNNNL